MSAGNSTVIDTTHTAISSESSSTTLVEPTTITTTTITTTTSPIETTTTSPLTSTTVPSPTSTSTTTTSPLPSPPTSTSISTSTPTTSATTITTVVTEISTANGIPTTVTVTLTSTHSAAPSNPTGDTSVTSSTTTTSTGIAQTGGAETSPSTKGGLSGGALVAVAVIVPVVVLAIVAVGLVLYFKRRKTNRNVPPKGPVAGGIIGTGGPPPGDGPYEMNETDNTGYRGWGSTARNPKSTIAGSSGYPTSPVGKTVSDGGYSNPTSVSPPGYTGNVSELYGGVGAPASPVFPDSAGLLAADRAVPSPAFTESSTIGAMPTFDSHNPGGLNRGISNASSNYSAMTHSDQSDFDQRQSQQYYGADAQDYEAAYFSNGPNMYYDDTSNPPPVIRDVQARRNTRIETPTNAHFPQQGSSGIAQNF